jgi:hypothetical protein
MGLHFAQARRANPLYSSLELFSGPAVRSNELLNCLGVGDEFFRYCFALACRAYYRRIAGNCHGMHCFVFSIFCSRQGAHENKCVRSDSGLYAWCSYLRDIFPQKYNQWNASASGLELSPCYHGAVCSLNGIDHIRNAKGSVLMSSADQNAL